MPAPAGRGAVDPASALIRDPAWNCCSRIVRGDGETLAGLAGGDLQVLLVDGVDRRHLGRLAG